MASEWIGLADAVVRISQVVGDEDAAWTELNKALRWGEVRSRAAESRFYVPDRTLLNDYARLKRPNDELSGQTWQLISASWKDNFGRVDNPERDTWSEFADIHVWLEDIERHWPSKKGRSSRLNQLPRNKPGKKPTQDWEAIQEAFDREVRDKGLPEPLNEDGWQSQADIERWIRQFVGRDGPGTSKTTVKGYARRFMADARQKVGRSETDGI